MTQCEEIKKKLQKALPIHTLDEKKMEHLPEFNDPLQLKKPYTDSVKVQHRIFHIWDAMYPA